MQTVVIYGNSLGVSSTGASLQACPDLKVLLVDPAMPNVKKRLDKLQPDVIIFDLSASQPEWMIALWKAKPHLLLIGVDLKKGQALVLSNQPARAFTTEDLLQVIERNAGNDSGPPGRSSQTRGSK